MNGRERETDTNYYLIPYDYGGSDEKYVIDPTKKSPLAARILVWGIVIFYWFQFLSN